MSSQSYNFHGDSAAARGHGGWNPNYVQQAFRRDHEGWWQGDTYLGREYPESYMHRPGSLPAVLVQQTVGGEQYVQGNAGMMHPQASDRRGLPVRTQTAAGPPRMHMYSGAAAPGVEEYNMIPALHFGHNSSRSGAHDMPTWGGSRGGAARGGYQRRGRGHWQPRRATPNTVSAGVRVKAQTDTETDHIALPDDIPRSSVQLQEETQEAGSRLQHVMPDSATAGGGFGAASSAEETPVSETEGEVSGLTVDEEYPDHDQSVPNVSTDVVLDKMAEIMQLLDKLQDDNAAVKNMNGILVAQLSDCQSRLHHLERHAAAIDGHCQWEPLCIQLALYCTRTPRHIEPCSTSSTESE